MKIILKLYRPMDRHPDQHLYGEPFDTKLDKLVGGAAGWSSPRVNAARQPTATVPRQEILVELHEDGPQFLFEILIRNIDQIPNYINAVAALISAWAVTRELRKREIPKKDPWNKALAKSGTIIEVGDLRLESGRNLKPKEVTAIITSLVNLQRKSPKLVSKKRSNNSKGKSERKQK